MWGGIFISSLSLNEAFKRLHEFPGSFASKFYDLESNWPTDFETFVSFIVAQAYLHGTTSHPWVTLDKLLNPSEHQFFPM